MSNPHRMCGQQHMSVPQPQMYAQEEAMCDRRHLMRNQVTEQAQVEKRREGKECPLSIFSLDKNGQCETAAKAAVTSRH